MKIKIKKLHSGAVIPSYAMPGDAGMDVFSVDEIVLAPGARAQVKTGIAMEIPEEHAILIWDKSGLSHKHGLKTMGGVIDCGYRGEIMVGVANLSEKEYIVRRGDKIAQLLIQQVFQPEIEEVNELPTTERGIRGFGSTGK